MKRATILPPVLTLLLLAALVWVIDLPGSRVSAADGPQAATAWFWGPVVNTRAVFLGDYDNRTIVVEGRIGDRIEPEAWNRYQFTGSDDTAGDYPLIVNLADAMPIDDVPRSGTVRIIGEPDNAEVDVFGLELMGETTIAADATVSEINSGDFDDADVVVEGQIRDLVDDSFNIYKFSDTTGPVDANFPDELATAQLPIGRDSIVYAQVKVNGTDRELDAELILLVATDGGDDTPTPTNTPTSSPTAEPEDTPSGTARTYLPFAARVADATPTSTNTPSPTPTPTATPPTDWAWVTSHTVAQVNTGCCDEQVVAVEGTVGDKDGTHPDWNEYSFYDGSGSIILDFEDQIPSSAIPQGDTVRVIGKSANNDIRKIDVYGLQTLGDVGVQANRTVAEISSGCCKDQDVAVKGTAGAQDTDYPGWNIYDFSAGGATIKANFEDSLTDAQVPRTRAMLLFGQGGDLFGTPQLDADFMLVANNIE